MREIASVLVVASSWATVDLAAAAIVDRETWQLLPPRDPRHELDARELERFGAPDCVCPAEPAVRP